MNLAHTYARLGRLMDAEATYMKVFDMNNSRIRALLYAALAMEKQGRTRDAIDTYRKYLARKPNEQSVIMHIRELEKKAVGGRQ
jgi:tetratricopeptide (TPR) repeat protein